MAPDQFIAAESLDPHVARARQMLAAHPELRQLAGPMPSTMLWILSIVALQVAVAVVLRDSPWWLLLACAYTIGAVCNHALFVLIHDCVHNLVFSRAAANRLAAITANLALGIPVALAFGRYHLLHHRHMGVMELDADLPGPVEASVIGRSPMRKMAWLFFFPIVEGVVRPLRLTSIKLLDGWIALNVMVQIAAMGLLVGMFGWTPAVYLVVSTFFSVGLHPLGARWIQEHFIFRDGQETYSYYGALNAVAFNVGYHNEHHDLVTVPWRKLPLVRSTAHEFYDELYYHRSWFRLLGTFLFGRSVGLHNRIVRSASPTIGMSALSGTPAADPRG